MRPALALLIPLAVCLNIPAQEKGKAPSYWPLKVGTTWVYRVGDRTLTVRVVKHEPVGTVSCARLEAVMGAATRVEHVAVQPDGIYRYQADGKKVEPPLCVLPLPIKAGRTWKLASMVDLLAVTGTCTLETAKVVVPAGTYQAVAVACPDFEIAGRRLPTTSWLAPGIGPVKQVINDNGVEVVLELERFVPGP
jgi:hypothetical protein